MHQAFTVTITLTLGGMLLADEPSSSPRPIAVTRPEMKRLIEDMKQRKPRIPLPELTAEEKAKLDDRGGGYEGRLRSLYLQGQGSAFGGGGRGGAPGGAPGGGQGNREPEPNMTLDGTFKTQLFWIVCRTNNCQYCQGHQESKLLRAGQTEDQIAGLDGDWSEYSPAQQAAFAFARKITYQPHLVTDADIDSLRKHYKDLQILEIILSTAGNNAINRWKEGIGVPQSAGGGGGGRQTGTEPPAAAHSYLTPTSEKYKNAFTRVAVLPNEAKFDGTTAPCVFTREPLEPRAFVERALEACAHRKLRLPLVDEAKAREILPEGFSKEPLPQWVRLLANFPNSGKNRILSQQSTEEKGELTQLLKAQVSWIIARQDRAWYALGLAKKKLQDLGISEDQIYLLDGNWAEFSPAERAMFKVAQKLAASPVVLTDEDVALALKLTGPRDVVQLINYVTVRASFDRITEAAGLQLAK